MSSDNDYNIYRDGYISIRNNREVQFTPSEMELKKWLNTKLVQLVIDKYGFYTWLRFTYEVIKTNTKTKNQN